MHSLKLEPCDTIKGILLYWYPEVFTKLLKDTIPVLREWFRVEEPYYSTRNYHFRLDSLKALAGRGRNDQTHR